MNGQALQPHTPGMRPQELAIYRQANRGPGTMATCTWALLVPAAGTTAAAAVCLFVASCAVWPVYLDRTSNYRVCTSSHSILAARVCCRCTVSGQIWMSSLPCIMMHAHLLTRPHHQGLGAASGSSSAAWQRALHDVRGLIAHLRCHCTRSNKFLTAQPQALRSRKITTS
jgi:hypothetical protein